MITLRLQQVHEDILFDDTRFKVVNAGRGFLKTGLLLAEVVKDLETEYTDLYGYPLPNRIWYTAPTYRQGKEICWDRAKQQLKPITAGRPNETELSIPLINGGEFAIKGSDKPDSLRGPYLTRFLGDEFAYHKPGYFFKVIFPMLSKVHPHGGAALASSPNGFGEFRDYHQLGQGLNKDWRSWTYTSLQGGFITAEEIEAAKAFMDETTWRQEFHAEFIGHSGRVCRTWSPVNLEETHYRPDLRIFLTCDFNVDPMCWEMAHRFNGEYHFFDEMAKENTYTQETAEEFASRYCNHTAGITITGDASGRNRSTKSSETDYAIILNTLRERGIPDVRLDLRTANPPIMDRINAWNSAVCSMDGVVKVKVNPKTCPKLVWNCENLTFIPGTSVIQLPSREDMAKTPLLKFTEHPFAAASYLIERYDPIKVDIPNANKPRVTSAPFRPR